jgi:hypothetical protein
VPARAKTKRTRAAGPARGRPVVLPPLVSAKVALYEAMRAQRITRTGLARRLGLQTRRRLHERWTP